MKTRTKKPSKVSATNGQPSGQNDTNPKTLERSVKDPVKLFVLPKDISSDSRIITLPNPSDKSTTSRFLFCPQRGCFEFTVLSLPKFELRSWLLAPDRTIVSDSSSDNLVVDKQDAEGYVLQSPDLFMATPFDPLFIVLPLMVDGESDKQGTFLSFPDYIFTQETPGYEHLRHILREPAFVRLQSRMEARMRTISDQLTLGDDDDVLYQLSMPKLTKELTVKARKMADAGLPPSMEQKFIRQALEPPVLGVRREESTISIATNNDDTPAASEASSACVSQETNTTTTSDVTVSTSATSIPEDSDIARPVHDEVLKLLQLRTALNYIVKSSVPSELQEKLDGVLASDQSPIDFKPLDDHLKHIAKLRQEAQALRSLSDNINRKRAYDDEEAMEKAEAKKKKIEEEELRKKNTSHGVKKLMKADTSGMKKLSSFFSKAPAKKT